LDAAHRRRKAVRPDDWRVEGKATAETPEREYLKRALGWLR
jgi:hypothetical protein